MAIELEAPLQSQVSSPAQDDRSEESGQDAVDMEKQAAQVTAPGGRTMGRRVGKAGQEGGRHSDAGMDANSNQGARLARVILLSSAHPAPHAWVGRDGQATNWLKSLLPESQNGWWEVDVKGKGLAIKFRWRDPRRRTLLFPLLTSEQFKTLKESKSEEASRILRERIAANLQNFFLDPAKRDKALVAAKKLGIDCQHLF